MKKKHPEDPRSSRSDRKRTEWSNRRRGLHRYGHEILLLLFLGGLVFLIYSNSLQGPFLFDDTTNITTNPHIRLTELSLGGLMRAGFESRSSRRPVANMSFALNYYLHRYNVLGYHLVNVLIHIITAILLYLFIKTTLGVPSQRPRYESYKWIPLLTALIWAVHPVQTQSVTYIVQRMNSMAAMFYVLSLLLYARGRLAGGRWKKWTLFAGCGIAGILALGSKQNAAMLPFFILLYEWYFFQDLDKDWLKRRLRYFLGMLILLGLIAFLYLGTNAWEEIVNQRDFVDHEFTFTERVLTQFRVVIHYISLLVFPHPSRLNLDYDFPLSYSLIVPVTTLVSMLAIAVLIGLAIHMARKERLLSFCILWFFGNLVIESSVIPVAIIFEHRAYLPSMLMSLAAVTLGYRYIKLKWLGVGLLSVAVVLFSIWTYERNGIWSDEETFWTDCVAKSPRKARPHLALGFALAGVGKLEQAMEHYKEALRIDPDYEEAHNNLGIVLNKQKRYQEAMEHYNEALRIKPNYPNAHINLASALQREEKFEEAFFHYSEALRLNPYSAEARSGLGTILDKQGRFKEAIFYYSEALRFNPDYADAHNNLGLALVKQGRVSEAVSHYYEALKINPEYAEAHNNLGVALERQGKFEAATKHYKEALRVRPDYAKAHYNLGGALVRQHRIEEGISHFYEALKIKPGYWQAHFNLGAALSRQGRDMDAAFHFSEVLRIKPDEMRARRALELLSK